MRSADPNAPIHYVYLHRRATDGSIFYVGKGKGRRAWSHQGRNPWWNRIVAKHGFYSEIIASSLPEKCALTLERINIRILGRDGLANLVDGGGGIPGWHHSDETKARISAFNKGKTPSARALAALRSVDGKKRSTEHRMKLSLAKKGKAKGPLSEETKKKISAAHIGLRHSSDTLRKMSESKVGKAVGRSSPSYDHTVRKFFHGDGSIFQGTRGDFILAFALANGDVSAVIHGRQKSVKGWRLA